MKLTCAQMDILISFYLENEISPSLKKQVEEHLQECSVCAAKYDIVKSMISEMKESVAQPVSHSESSGFTNSHQYNLFKTNLSAYIDNELPNNENIKIKKFAINNKKARQDLENSYSLRKLMKDSFNKAKVEAKRDFSKCILKQLELEDEKILQFHPAIKLLIVFTLSVLTLTTIVLISLNL